ncbi:hypothetical protein MMC29_007419 [Sticta canariensis]|nr:hypothetical protein [Sticta canariensis]
MVGTSTARLQAEQYRALVVLFLTHGADPNLPHGRGLFPLEIAAHHAPLDTAQLLLSHGAKLENSRALNAAAAGSKSDRIPVLTFRLDHAADIHTLAPDLNPCL